MAQIWYDLSILRMFTVVKCRGHANFDLSKIYEGYFQLTNNLVHLDNISRDLISREREKSMVKILSQLLKHGSFKTTKISKK